MTEKNNQGKLVRIMYNMRPGTAALAVFFTAGIIFAVIWVLYIVTGVV